MDPTDSNANNFRALFIRLPIISSSMWLDVCGWTVPAGFPSPAADHTEERIDLNKQLIRNKAAGSLDL